MLRPPYFAVSGQRGRAPCAPLGGFRRDRIAPMNRVRHVVPIGVVALVALVPTLAHAQAAPAAPAAPPGGAAPAQPAAPGQPLAPSMTYSPQGTTNFNPQAPNGTIGGGNASESSAHLVTGEEEDSFDI